ncbi:DUF6331 family protein [Fibrivirga algicola]|uniref:Uncharacterized protein n=1 Tax=Fibrivirga algicola TaxID=2950420 RepID=A0ABX0QFN5_9BACT|nr:DUF6331 family protein [Fibrivirga algicola]NID09543.1 hypothetical protein [Fibrivirga algicola]
MTERERLLIGPDKEIILLEFDYDSSPVLEVDAFLGSYSDDVMLKYANAKDPLGQFWNKAETVCMIACCGIYAFDLWPDNIAKVVQELDKVGLLKQLENLKNQVLNSSEQIVSYYRLNQNFAKVSFLELLNYLITEVKSSSLYK